MPRYPQPFGYRNLIPDDPMQAPPMPSVNRSERKHAYAAQLKDQFDGVLLTAISMWGVAYVRERVARALANATAAGR